MTESERLLRSILGPTRSDIRPLAFAIAVAEELLFNQGLAMDDVQITKQIYPMVARQFRKTDNAAAKCVERLSRLCWEAMVAQDLVAQYLGRAIQQSPTPRSLIVYLAVYSHTGSPFYTVIEEDPYFLFQLPESVQSPSAADSTSDEPHTPRGMALSRMSLLRGEGGAAKYRFRLGATGGGVRCRISMSVLKTEAASCTRRMMRGPNP